MNLLRLIPPAVLGVLIGGVLGSIVTGGDPLFTIAWAVAVPALILSLLLVGGTVMARKRRTEATPVLELNPSSLDPAPATTASPGVIAGRLILAATSRRPSTRSSSSPAAPNSPT